MKVIWPIDVKHNDCPTCHSVLVTFNGEHCICPSCAAIEIERSRADRLAWAKAGAREMLNCVLNIAENKRDDARLFTLDPAAIARRAVEGQEKP